jgi:hypothetical protein
VPPRYAYWTILIDHRPTAFRARDREELMPTLVQLRRTNPNVEMKWFARGRLWDTPEQAQWAARNMPARAKRGKDWRPGGQHKDPRARVDLRRKVKTARPPAGAGGPPKAFGDKPRKPFGGKPFAARPRKPFDAGERKSFHAGHRKPFGTGHQKPFSPRQQKPFDPKRQKPFGAGHRKPFGASQQKPFDTRRQKPFDAARRKPFDPHSRPQTGGTPDRPFRGEHRTRGRNAPAGDRERKPPPRPATPGPVGPEHDTQLSRRRDQAGTPPPAAPPIVDKPEPPERG